MKNYYLSFRALLIADTRPSAAGWKGIFIKLNISFTSIVNFWLDKKEPVRLKDLSD